MLKLISRCGPDIRMAGTTPALWSASTRRFLPGSSILTDHSPTRLTPSWLMCVLNPKISCTGKY